MGELWCVFCKIFGENWSEDIESALYLNSNPIVLCISDLKAGIVEYMHRCLFEINCLMG